MEQILLTLILQDGQLCLVPETQALGSQFDSHAKSLVFTRPTGYEMDNLLLFFEDAVKAFSPISLGTENCFSIPETLTQTRWLRIQAAFERNGEILIHSDVAVFDLRLSLNAGQTSPPPYGLRELADKAFAGAEITAGTLRFRNTAGAELTSVVLPEGGGISALTPDTPVTGIPDGKLISVLDGKVIGVDPSAGGALTPETPATGFLYGEELTVSDTGKVAAIKGSGTIYNRRIMLFGDSITTSTAWRAPFKELIGAASLDNFAVSGAQWRDNSTAVTVLDGNPVTGNPNNVIANQVQKVINNINNYEIPEIVIFYAGVNDSYGTAHSSTNIDQYYVSGGNYIPLESLDRKNLGAAIRWSVEKIREVYPYTHIILVTPYQTAAGWTAYSVIRSTRDVIVESAIRLGVPCVDLFNTSGIYGAFETKGAAGRYLSDGLHPGTEGGRIIACRIFDAVRQLSFPYREINPKTNLLRNADFSNGTTNWVTDTSNTLSASGGILTLSIGSTFNSSSFSMRQTGIRYVPGHKYYMRIMARSDLLALDEFSARWFSATSPSVSIGWFTTKTADWTLMSAIATATADCDRVNTVIQFKAATTTPRGRTVQYTEPILLDLTEIYGAGNEPTASYLDGQIRFFAGTAAK